MHKKSISYTIIRLFRIILLRKGKINYKQRVLSMRKGLNAKKLKDIFINAIMIVAGSAIYGLAISVLLSPNNLAPGGVSGVAIMVNYVTSLPTGILVFCINIPIMLLGWWKLGTKFSILTLIAVFLTTGFIDLFTLIAPVTDNRILAALIGGPLMAVGIGLVFRAGSTTGGTDIIVRIIRKKYKHLRSGGIFLCIDFVIVAISAIVYNDIETGLYGAIALYCSSVMLDKVLYGADGAKMVYIITNKQEEIADAILEKLGVGATFLNGWGGYSGTEKKVIMCVMRKQFLPKVREVVCDIDDQTFMIVSPATEIFGEGFKKYNHEEL